MEEEPVETTNIPVKKQRGRPQSQEHMAQISKIGAETMKKIGTIRAYEKAKKKKEIEDKYAMIQNELSKQEVKELTQPTGEEEIKTTTKPKTKKTKKVIVEEVEESETEDDSEEEVIIKRVVKKKPSTRKVLDDDEEHDVPHLIQKSSIEMLRRKYDDNMKERLRQSLFDC